MKKEDDRTMKVTNLKRLLSLLLCAALLCGACACTGGGEGASSEPETTDPLPARIDLADYWVIRPDSAGEGCKKAATALYTRMQELYEAANRIGTDWIRPGDPIPAQAKELLVGATGRSESVEVCAALKEDDYAIRVFPESGRIVIAGGGDEATMKAVERFIQDYLTAPDADGKYTVPETLSVTETGAYDIERLTLCGHGIGEYSLVIPQKADRDEQYAAALIADAVRAATGVTLATVKDGAAGDVQGPKILIGATGLTPAGFLLQGADAGYVLGTSEAGILAAGDGGMTVRAARELIAQLLPEGKKGQVDVTLPAATVTPREKTSYPATPELGTMPVALTDQKNAVAVVYDFGAILSGTVSLPVWTFKPTSKLGFSSTDGYGNRIDEAKLRYSSVLGKYVVLFCSSSGFVGVAEYPSGQRVWSVSLSGYGPHSMEYLPNGNVALALSGNGNADKSVIRVYAVKEGGTGGKCATVKLDSAHAVQWDDVRGILWALGSSVVTAYEIGGTQAEPTLTQLSVYTTSHSFGGHDMTPVYGDTDLLWIGGAGAFSYDKTSGKVTKLEAFADGGTKTVGAFPDGTVIRSVATGVYASHDTDHVRVAIPNGSGSYSLTTVIFPDADRAFYKARIFLPDYS